MPRRGSIPVVVVLSAVVACDSGLDGRTHEASADGAADGSAEDAADATTDDATTDGVTTDAPTADAAMDSLRREDAEPEAGDAGTDARDASVGGDGSVNDSGGDADAGCHATECEGICCSGKCAAGRCLETLAQSQSVAGSGLAVDSTYLYWAAPGPGSGYVMRVPIVGGSPVPVAASPASPYALAVDSTSVYWTAVSKGGGGGGWVLRAPLGGGATITIAKQQKQETPRGIALDATFVYWVAEDAVRRAPLSGKAVVTLASAVNAQAVAVAPSGVYWTQDETDSVMRVALDGGAAMTFASGSSPEAIAANDAGVFWSVSGGVLQTPLDGGAALKLASVDYVPPGSLFVDGDEVYVATYTGGAIVRVPVGGGAVVTLASGQPDTWGVVVDATSVYFATVSGSIMKLTPK